MMTNDKEITPAIHKSLTTLISLLGGAKCASSFIGLSERKLADYVSGNKKIIDGVTWTSMLSKLTKNNCANCFPTLSTEFRELRSKADKLQVAEYKYTHLQNENEKLIVEIASSPFNVYFSEFASDCLLYDYPILRSMDTLNEHHVVPISELAVNLYSFGRIYELFRPQIIHSSHPYWGTVGTMDAIFRTLAGVFDIQGLNTFSKFGVTFLDSLNKCRLTVDKVDWNRLTEDVKAIVNSIDRTMGELAINSNEYFKRFHTFQYSLIAKKYITTVYRNFDLSLIDFSTLKPGSVVIAGETESYRNGYQLFSAIDKKCRKELHS